MAKPRPLPLEHRPFAALPVRMITVGRGAEQMAVHVVGRARAGPPAGDLRAAATTATWRTTPISCGSAGPLLGPQTPIVLVDLKGRGRSSDRPALAEYSSINDAADLVEVTRALAIEHAIFVGQGYGGQVLMALAAERPSLMSAVVLIDAGPVSDSRGLVRLRVTLADLMGMRGDASLRPMLRRMVVADYPDAPEDMLEDLAFRTHFVDRRGGCSRCSIRS